MKRLFFIILMLLSVVGCLAYPKEAAQALSDGFALWFTKVLPSLMPIGIIAGILTRTNISGFFGALLYRPVNALFGISGQAGYTFFISIISGYPMGALTIAEQFESGQISAFDVKIMQALCTNCGILFAVGTVASGLLNMPEYSVLLYISHILSAVIVSLFLGLIHNGSGSSAISIKKAYNGIDLSSLGVKISDSFAAVIHTMLRIGVYIAVFSLAIKLLGCCGALSVVVKVFERVIGHTASALVPGILEITNGCSVLPSLALGTGALPIAAALITWSGLSIQMQSIPYLNKVGIKAFSFIKTKAIQSIIAYMLCTAYLSSFITGLLITLAAIFLPIILRRFCYFSFSSICSRAAWRSSRQPPM